MYNYFSKQNRFQISVLQKSGENNLDPLFKNLYSTSIITIHRTFISCLSPKIALIIAEPQHKINYSSFFCCNIKIFNQGPCCNENERLVVVKTWSVSSPRQCRRLFSVQKCIIALYSSEFINHTRAQNFATPKCK